MLNIQAYLKTLAESGVFRTSGSGAPTNGTSGTGVGELGPGSEYVDYTNHKRYLQIGSVSSPYWFDLNGDNEYVFTRRCTTAEVNAGLTLLSAIAGYKYQVTDMSMIAIGGNAGATTTVDILGTIGAAGSKLLATAVAALTRSTLNRAGAANNTILADGASFQPLDVNTAITIGVTGAAMTVATHIDVTIRYKLVKA